MIVYYDIDNAVKKNPFVISLYFTFLTLTKNIILYAVYEIRQNSS